MRIFQFKTKKAADWAHLFQVRGRHNQKVFHSSLKNDCAACDEKHAEVGKGQLESIHTAACRSRFTHA